MQPLRFGIIGAGNIAKTHAAAIAASPHAHLVAVSGGRSAAQFAADTGSRHYQDVDDLLKAQDVDAVILCTPSGARLEVGKRAAENGKHVLVEKPIEVTLSRAMQLVEACERSGVQLGVIFQSRFKPDCRQAREAVTQGRLGQVLLANAYVKWHRPADYYESASWRGTWTYDGGGALMNQAIHSVDMLVWLLGDVKTVTATTANLTHKRIEVEDTALAILEFESGALGTIEATTAIYPGQPKRICIQGSRGSIELRDDIATAWNIPDELEPRSTGQVQEQEGSGSEASHIVADYAWHQLQIEEMAEAIRSNRRPAVDGYEGLRSLKVVLAAYESARRHRPVRLADLSP